MYFCENFFIVICYVDDCCIFYKYKETIDASLKNLSKTFNLTYEGYVKFYLGMNVNKDPNVTITMSQFEIIDQILNSLEICGESTIHDTPANFILTKDEDGNERNK